MAITAAQVKELRDTSGAGHDGREKGVNRNKRRYGGGG